MTRTIVDVIRGEGFASAVRRARERLTPADRFDAVDASIVNVAASISPRSGGVAVQLLARLRAERALRKVRLATTLPSDANAIHIEGMSGVPFADVLRLIESGVRVVISVHDFSLFCSRPHLLEEPFGHFCHYSQDLDRCARCLGAIREEQAERRDLARRILTLATGVIFPSHFLRAKHRVLFSLPEMGEVIEPSSAAGGVATTGRGIAYAGSVKRHKGGQLLPDIARALEVPFHVFGGGDRDLLLALRRVPNVVIHGYYRSGTLPSLLVRHRIGLVVLPSIVPEAYSLTLSESWQAGASVAAFDLGAIAERIRRDGGGWLAPLDSGAHGLIEIIERWRSGATAQHMPRVIPSSAEAHVALYRKWGLLG
jgi:hypothetical protein